jgi:hypothetical protein
MIDPGTVDPGMIAPGIVPVCPDEKSAWGSSVNNKIESNPVITFALSD